MQSAWCSKQKLRYMWILHPYSRTHNIRLYSVHKKERTLATGRRSKQKAKAQKDVKQFAVVRLLFANHFFHTIFACITYENGMETYIAPVVADEIVTTLWNSTSPDGHLSARFCGLLTSRPPSFVVYTALRSNVENMNVRALLVIYWCPLLAWRFWNIYINDDLGAVAVKSTHFLNGVFMFYANVTNISILKFYTREYVDTFFVFFSYAFAATSNCWSLTQFQRAGGTALLCCYVRIIQLHV